MKSLKILIVTHYFQPHIGGIEIVAYNQAKELVKKGNKVTIITSKIQSSKAIESIDGFKVIRTSASNFFENHFRIPYPIFSYKIIPALALNIKKNHIIHLHDIFYISSILSAIFSIIYKKPYIITQHVAHVKHPNIIVNFIQFIIYQTLGRLMLFHSKKVITYNNNVTKFVNDLSIKRNKIIEIKHGTDLALFHPINKIKKLEIRKKYNLPINKAIVLFVGRFVPKKGVDKLLQAQAEKYLIVFVGNDANTNNIVEVKNVRFLGKLDRNTLSEIYQACDIFILPSEGEIFTLTMQEAMATGLPIITSNDPAYKNYSIDKKYIKLITPTSSSIKKTILDLIKNKKLQKEMSDYSLRLAREKFNWDKNYNQLLNVYRSIKL